MSPLFEAVNVTKTFGGLTAVHHVTFALDGGIASIIGPTAPARRRSSTSSPVSTRRTRAP